MSLRSLTALFVCLGLAFGLSCGGGGGDDDDDDDGSDNGIPDCYNCSEWDEEDCQELGGPDCHRWVGPHAPCLLFADVCGDPCAKECDSDDSYEKPRFDCAEGEFCCWGLEGEAQEECWEGLQERCENCLEDECGCMPS